MIPIKIRLLNKPEYIEKAILSSFVDHINNATQRAIPDIDFKFSVKIVDIVKKSPTYNSLLSGILRQDFGLENPKRVVNGILGIWSDEIKANFNGFRVRGGKIYGELKIGVVDASFNNVLNSQYASYMSNQYFIPWLEWLLKRGAASVVKGYHVEYGPSQYSRAGNALMFSGGKFSVDSAFAGTAKDNFITEAMDAATSDFEKIMQEEIERRL